MTYFGQALNIRQRAGDRHSQATSLLYLGRAQRQAGQVGSARKSWTEALTIFTELEDEEGVAQVRLELAVI